MANSDLDGQRFIKKHKFTLQTFAFVALLILPFFLYVAAQAQLEAIVIILLGLMTLIMLALSVIS